MRFFLPVVLLLSLFGATSAQTSKKQITLKDIWKNGTFRVKDVPGFNAIADGTHYTQIDRDSNRIYINVYNLETGAKEKTLFDNYSVPSVANGPVAVDNYEFSKNEQKLLLFTESENIYRRSVLNRVYVYDIAARTMQLLDYDKVLHATFSPDGKKVAYVKNNNLFVKDLQSGAVVAVTADGQKNAIINGNCDWVYEEEFEFTRAFEWSNDSRYIAYYRFDESMVPQYTIAKYNDLYPEQYQYKYPKAGERNSIVQIRVYNVADKKTVNADLGTETDQYIPRIKWTATDGKLCIYRLNRHQNHLEMLLTDAVTGKYDIIYSETNKYYISINDRVIFLPNKHSMVISSEKNGYNHLYKYDWTTKRSTDLSPGNFDIDALIGVNTDAATVYYTAAENSPLQRNLYAVQLDGSNKKCLTPEKGTHSITPCEGYHYFLDRFSTINSVPVYYLRDAAGKIIRTLEDNKALAAKMNEYDLGKIKLIKINGANGKLNAWMITPPDFDSTKKYPVFMYQYSGPGSQEVADRFPLGNYFWHQMLAEHGYIVVCADGTGTGFRGEEFRKKTYLQLGKYESDDQIAVAKSLGTLPYVNKDRIGIWGWSYGGFMSSTCIMKGADVFKMAIAVAPVTNWRYYDNIYTDRYMRTPQENEKGYDENAPVKMVDKLKGKFLLVHGTADDNVHFQNSAMLLDALINADKEFDSEFYPNKNHGIYGGNTRYHLYKRMTDFVLNNL